MTDEGETANYRWSVPPIHAWRLLTEPMSQEEAKTASRAITAAVPHVHASPANPRQHLLLVWERRSVEMFREALQRLADQERPVPAHILRDMDKWLELADPYGPDDLPWPQTY